MNGKRRSLPKDSRTELQAQVRDLADRVRRAEAFSRRIQVIELKVLESDNLVEMVRIMDRELRREFAASSVHLVVADPEHELTRLLESDESGRELLGKLVVPSYEERISPPAASGVVTGPAWVASLPDLPPRLVEQFTAAVSGFALPLVRRREVVGCLLVLGDRPTEVDLDEAGEFLTRFAAIVAVGLENVLNYERLKQAGLTDPLTAVNNRRFFDQRIFEESSRAKRLGQTLAAMMVDVDFFKRINDERGHLAGDRVLKQIASLLAGRMRHSDVLARYGGEEFVLLLPDTPLDVAMEVAERLRVAVAEHEFDIDAGAPLGVTVSIGVAAGVFSGPRSQTPQGLISAADTALYRAKAGGRNRVVAAQEGNTAG